MGAWLRQCGGRSNPDAVANASWMTHVFTFFDENGASVNMTGSQVLSTASQLNYRYDFKLILPCNFKIKWWLWKWRWWDLLKIQKDFRINEKLIKFSFREAKTDNLERFLSETRSESFSFSTKEASDGIFIQLDKIKFNKAPEGVVEVYINLPAGQQPNVKSKSFAGVLDLFSPTGHAHSNDNNTSSRINVSAAIQALGLKVRDLRNAEISFYVRGNSVQGREVKTVNDILISNANFVMQKAERSGQ